MIFQDTWSYLMHSNVFEHIIWQLIRFEHMSKFFHVFPTYSNVSQCTSIFIRHDWHSPKFLVLAPGPNNKEHLRTIFHTYNHKVLENFQQYVHPSPFPATLLTESSLIMPSTKLYYLNTWVSSHVLSCTLGKLCQYALSSQVDHRSKNCSRILC